MFKTALVALDLAPAEQPIVDCLPALQAWGVERVVLVHVVQVGYMQGAALSRQADYVDWLEALAQPLRTAGLAVEVQVRASGLPADDILAAAGEHQADLIVIGSRGHNLISKLFLGSVARSVLQKTTRPVLLEWVEPTAVGTRHGCAAVCTDTLRHVVLATDFSASAQPAEAAALHLATKARQVDCVHVLAAQAGTATGLRTAEQAQAGLDSIAQRISAAGSRGRGQVLQGPAAQEIARYASAQDATLIVVGKRGQNPLASLLIGSTAAQIGETAGRPVLMVPARDQA